MTDGQTLLLVFALLYAVESVLWVQRGAWVFRRRMLPRSWSGRCLEGSFELAARHPVLPRLIPPGELLLVAADPPCYPDEDGIWIAEAQAQAGQHLSWEEIRPRAVQSQLQLTNQVRLPCNSERAAIEWAERLDRITQARDRAAAVEAQWQEWANRARVRRVRRRWRRVHAALAAPLWWLFVTGFGLLPLTVWRLGWEHPSTWLAATALLGGCLWMTCTWASIDVRVLRRRPWPAWVERIQCLLYPPHAMAVIHSAGKEMTLHLHPLAVAREFLPQEEARRVTAPIWRRWRYPGKGDSLEPMHRALRHRLDALVIALGWDLQELQVSAPEAGTVCQCPRCGTAYQMPRADCADCRGVATVPIS
ncbi:MAG: hypothetical protein KDK99_17465 [Verrucomicrobiales bacterium]|nr:hypothetical protein [Verrucomicrobiales bacterium]